MLLYKSLTSMSGSFFFIFDFGCNLCSQYAVEGFAKSQASCRPGLVELVLVLVLVDSCTGCFVEEGIALVVEHRRAAAGVAGIVGRRVAAAVAVEEVNRTVH